MGLFGGGSKVSTKRIDPPERKLANAMLSLEAVRGLSGKEGFADTLERQRLRSQALEDVALQNRESMRGLGERGIESPGMYERLTTMREGALGNLIKARNEAILAKRAGATGILERLLAENPTYTKTKVKESGMSKAAPYMKMGGAVIGGVFGGPAGAALGSQVGGMAGEEAGKTTMAGSETAPTPGATPTSPAQNYSLQPPVGSTIPAGGSAGATLNEATGGEVGQDASSAITQLLKKPKSLQGTATGLAKLTSLFGGA